jgi:hypothetical protein
MNSNSIRWRASYTHTPSYGSRGQCDRTSRVQDGQLTTSYCFNNQKSQSRITLAFRILYSVTDSSVPCSISGDILRSQRRVSMM